MVKKSLAVLLFIVVSFGFLFGFITYNKRLSKMLDKKIDPSAVVLSENPSEPLELETETPEEEETEEEKPEVEEPEEESPLEEPDETSELVVIPYIIGLHKEDAVKALEEMNLVADVHLEYIDGVEKEYVFYQRPPKNQEVPEGTTVSFSVSRGPYGSSDEEIKAVVPALIGKTQAQAEKALMDAKLLVKVKEAYSSQVTKGNVISQDTSSGKEVEDGSTVTITVSIGEEPVMQVLVPDVTTLTKSDAENQIRNAGLYVSISEDYSETIDAGKVISQSPGNVMVDQGSTVAIVVSKGPVSEEPEEPANPEEPADPADPADPVESQING